MSTTFEPKVELRQGFVQTAEIVQLFKKALNESSSWEPKTPKTFKRKGKRELDNVIWNRGKLNMSRSRYYINESLQPFVLLMMNHEYRQRSKEIS